MKIVLLLLFLLPTTLAQGHSNNDGYNGEVNGTKTTTSTLFPGHIPCPPHQHQCDNGQCVPLNDSVVVCDTFPDCVDGSDEIRCGPNNCTEGVLACDNFTKCIEKPHRCDGIVDCDDRQDEMNCENTVCEWNEFRCSSGNCIHKDKVCNGRWDCRDGEDEEQDCGDKEPQVCTSEQFGCGDGSCHPLGVVCNGVKDCNDGSDEREDFCMKCNTSTGYRTVTKCNGIQECHKGVDELKCASCKGESVMCASQDSCVHPGHLCDGFYDCYDKSDEINCTCREGMFRCGDGSCIDHYQVCDGFADCPGMQDEEKEMCQEKCGMGMYQCKHGRCINTTKVCDGVVDCRLGEDESSDFCAHVGVCDEEKHFKCNRTGKCIFKEWRCDGHKDCHHGEDEDGCGRHNCTMHQFQCPNEMKCVDGEKRCDGKSDCQDFSDELGCIFYQKSPLNNKNMVFVQRGNHMYHLCGAVPESEVCNYMALSPVKRHLDMNRLSGNQFAMIDNSPNYFGSKYIGGKIKIGDVCSNGPTSLECTKDKSCQAKDLSLKVFEEKSSWPELFLLTSGPNSTKCGASWISSQTLLTSAACLRHANISDRNLVLPYGPYRVGRWMEHPNFDPITKQNDLTLIDAYTYSTMRWIPFAPQKYFCVSREASHLPYVSCHTMAEIDPADGVNPKHMAVVRVKLLNQKECIQALNKTRKWTYFPVVSHIDYKDFICAHYHNQNIGNKICQVSSGYPLVCTRPDGVVEQVGTSVMHPANTECRLGVFTNLRKKLDFIFTR